jgi:type I restriction enzyme S subunit
MELSPSFKQSEVGFIPTDWEVRPLLAAVRIATGQVDPRAEPFRSMILVAPDHIESKTGRLLEQRTASEQKAISGKYSFSAGDIVYSKIRPYLRKAVLVDFPGLCSADMYPLRSAPDVEAGFVLPVLLGERFSNYAESVSARSGMPKINRSELAEYSLALPPQPEQRAIATALSDVDTLLTKLDQLLTKKRDLKQAVMQQLLTGKTRLPGFNGEWVAATIGEVAVVKTGPFGSSLHEHDYVQDGTPIITVEHLGEFRVTRQNLPLISDEDCRRLNTYTLEAGDIVFSRVGSVDRNALIREDEAGWLFSGRLLRVRADKKRVVPAFLSHQFHTESFKNSVLAVAVGQTMASLNTKILKNLRVLVPSIAEQVAIATIVSDLNTEIEALESRRDKTRNLKQGMMQELLTGRIRLV